MLTLLKDFFLYLINVFVLSLSKKEKSLLNYVEINEKNYIRLVVLSLASSILLFYDTSILGLILVLILFLILDQQAKRKPKIFQVFAVYLIFCSILRLIDHYLISFYFVFSLYFLYLYRIRFDLKDRFFQLEILKYLILLLIIY